MGLNTMDFFFSRKSSIDYIMFNINRFVYKNAGICPGSRQIFPASIRRYLSLYYTKFLGILLFLAYVENASRLSYFQKFGCYCIPVLVDFIFLA